MAIAAFGEWHELNEAAAATLLTAASRAAGIYEIIGVEHRPLVETSA